MSSDKWEKDLDEGGLIAKEFPLEKGNSYHWIVRIKEAGEIFFLLLPSTLPTNHNVHSLIEEFYRRDPWDSFISWCGSNTSKSR